VTCSTTSNVSFYLGGVRVQVSAGEVMIQQLMTRGRRLRMSTLFLSLRCQADVVIHFGDAIDILPYMPFALTAVLKERGAT
jgi:hypothetical protein